MLFWGCTGRSPLYEGELAGEGAVWWTPIRRVCSELSAELMRGRAGIAFAPDSLRLLLTTNYWFIPRKMEGVEATRSLARRLIEDNESTLYKTTNPRFSGFV